MSKLWRAAGWALAALLIASPAFVRRGAATERPATLSRRLLGPFASLAASIQWLRFDAAVRAGRVDLALARADTAIALDPGATQGWVALAWHLCFDRGSAERERDPERRLAWIRAGLGAAARGEAAAREPAELALLRGLVLAKVAQEDPPAPWPGGERALWSEAAAAFERAAELGHPDGSVLAETARLKADDVGR